VALLKLALGDRDGYRAVCESALRKYRDDFQYTAVWNAISFTCILGPDAVKDFGPLLRTAERGLGPSEKEHASLQTLGAVYYRAGRFDEAARRLDEAVKARGRGGDAIDWLFLAMAHLRRRDIESGRRWLDKASGWIDASTPNRPEDNTFGERVDWQRWLTLQVLRREAETLAILDST
jgi:hypothetical protein